MKSSRDELREILAEATDDDLGRIVGALDRWPRPHSLAISLQLGVRHDVEEGIAMEIERAAKAPLTRIARRIGRQPARDDLHDAVTETARRLDVLLRVPIGGTLRGRIVAMTSAVIDRAAMSLPAEEQLRLLDDALDRSEPKTSMPDVVRAAAIPVLGREVARAAFLPALVAPATWAASGAMLAWELQKPAYRKLVPALLYVGLIALRKGQISTPSKIS